MKYQQLPYRIMFCISVAILTFWVCAAQAFDYPVLRTTISGPTSLGVVAPNETSTPVQIKFSATGEPKELAVAPNVPNAGFSYTPEVVSVQKLVGGQNQAQTTDGVTFIPPVNPQGARDQFFGITASFPNPGRYQIQIRVKTSWWAGSGEDRYSGTSPIYTLSIQIDAIPKNIEFSPTNPDATPAEAVHNSIITRVAPDNAEPLLVSASDEVTITALFEDQDYQKIDGEAVWTGFKGAGPYTINISVTGDAVLDSPNSTDKQKSIEGNSLKNQSIFIKQNAFEQGRPQSITIRVTLTDNAFPIVAPNTGTVKDTSSSKTWILIKKVEPSPTDMEQIDPPAPFGAWKEAATIYTYQMKPDDPNVAEYESQVVLEKFTEPTPYNFTMDDLDAPWKAANPDLTTPEAVVKKLFNAGINGSFRIDNKDQIQDLHTGVSENEEWMLAFTPASAQKGFGYDLSQTYSCSGTAVGNYTITRGIGILNNKLVVMVKKTGP